VPTDVSNREDCRLLIEKTAQRFHKVDVLVNNAGISMRAIFKEVELEVLRKVMEVNFWGTVYCTKYAFPYLLATKGSVIGVSSIAGYRGLPGRTGYSASKFAMQGFLEALRSENRQTGLHVMVACPGFTTSNIRNVAYNAQGEEQGETPRDEMKMMSAEEVADRVVAGTYQRKRTLVLTTQGRLTVFFNKWLPGWMDKMVYKHFVTEKDSPVR